MDANRPEAPGGHRLLRRLGRGGMAEVYLAEPPDGGPPVALKRLLPAYVGQARFVRMFEDEVRIASAIRHPHVARVFASGPGYLAMEYVDGLDLARMLRVLRARRLLLPIDLALYVARCVALGLQAAHALTDADGRPLHVTHRDVSPHNVLVSFEGDVKLIDFGVAKAVTNRNLTRSGVIKGKLQYMSPEQAQAAPIDARADLFSLGLTLYKLLTGRLPFAGRSELQIYDQILRREAPPPSVLRPEVPERVDAVVLRALRKAPERRFATAAEMAAVLDAVRGPGDAADLARFLAAEVRPWVEVGGSGTDDDVFDEASDPLPEGAPVPDDERVDALTTVGEPPLPVAIPVGPPVPEAPTVIRSSPSLPTGRLRGLRRRSLAYGAALLLTGAVAAILVVTLDGSPAPAVGPPVVVAPPDAAPRRDAAVAVAARPLVAAPDTTAPPPPKPAPPSEVGPGRVTITALPWAWVEIDGALLDRQTPITGLPLRPGRHKVRLMSPDKSAEYVQMVTVQPGRTAAVGHRFE
jgi:serine/threonine-protein kinase